MFSYQTAHYLIAAVLLAIAFYAHTKHSRKVAVAVAAAAGVIGLLAYRQGDKVQVKLGGGSHYRYHGAGPSVAADYFMEEGGDDDLPSTVM